MAKRHERTRARMSALQVLYTSEIQGAHPSEVAVSEKYLSEDGKDLSDYARKLVEGVEAHRVGIDKMLSSTSENWSLARMPIVDRSILRLATYEMTYVDDVPVSVAINEAVELAKGFGGKDESPQFVNGVLGRIAAQLEERAKGHGGQGDQDGHDGHDGQGEASASAHAAAVSDAEAAGASCGVDAACSATATDADAEAMGEARA